MVQAAVMISCSTCGAENPEGQRYCGSCAAPLQKAVRQREQRKTVTAVFCDVVGSTALGESRDPEAVRVLLAGYFERMRSIVEAHGGTVQKFIGDAVVAIFGVPTVHEDDALRAARAADEMRRSLPELGIEARLGVNTGEVVTSADDTLVTGDAVNVAARLQQAASPGEVLVGAATLALAGSTVEVEKLEPLELKGKTEPVQAYRLVAVRAARGRAHGSRFVGRGAELALLRSAWGRAVKKERCELVTVVGEPGVGKSRLVVELIERLDARVARGGCLSYGEGITYSPVVEVVRQLDMQASDPAVAAAIGSLLGESGTATSPDEIAWAFRKLLEASAPLVVVFDDIQWGEETFLDLVEQVALFSSEAPILLVCLARPELGERRPGWPVTLRLEPLPDADVDELLPASVSLELRERIARAAGGNPLFVTEMAAMAAGDGEEVVVPPTLKALLAARLDRLDSAERSVLGRGSVEGELFHRGAVQSLDPGGGAAAPLLMALVRQALIRPDRPLLHDEDGFRFCHLLIRDAAYDALPKRMRAQLHERFAEWLDVRGADLVERDEIVGYHLQQSYRYCAELGDPEGTIRQLGERAAARLAVAGYRATTRGDFHAAASLLERALELRLADPGERVRVEVALGHALHETGQVSKALAVLADAHDAATALGERGVAALALVHRAAAQMAKPDCDLVAVQMVCEVAIEAFGELGDECGLASAERLLGLSLGRQGDPRTDASFERALVHAGACGDPDVRRRVIGTFLTRLPYATTPVGVAIDRCEQLLSSTEPDRVLEALIKRFLAWFYAMADRPDEAIELVRESSLVLDELNQRTFSLYRTAAAQAKELAGDRAGAEQELLKRWSYFSERSDHGIDHIAVETAYRLATFYCDSGRWDDAERFASMYRDLPLTGRHALEVAANRLAVEARLAARSGRLDEAVALAEDAIARADSTEQLNFKAGIWAALAEVQRANGNKAQAEAALASALALYDRKGNIAAAARLRAVSDTASPTQAP